MPNAWRSSGISFATARVSVSSVCTGDAPPPAPFGAASASRRSSRRASLATMRLSRVNVVRCRRTTAAALASSPMLANALSVASRPPPARKNAPLGVTRRGVNW